jgi:hypothetical protein
MLSKFKLCAVFAALAIIAATNAQATGTPTPPPATPAPTTITSGAAAGAAAGAVSGSRSDAVSNSGAAAGANATGGSATGGNAAGGSARQGQGQAQRQAATSGASITDNGSTSTENSMYVLPSPVFTPPMAAVNCPAGVEITNEAFSLGWSAISAARGHTDNSACVLITLRNAYVEQCQYASAKQVQDLLTAKMLPGFVASGTAYLDLTRGECDALRAPVAPVVRTETVYISVPAPAAAPVAVPPKKRIRTVFPVKKCKPAAALPACRS